MEDYQNEADHKHRIPIDIHGQHNWDEVITSMEGAIEAMRRKYKTEDLNGFWGKVRKQSTYGSVLCGGLTLILVPWDSKEKIVLQP
ncbi:hypothetical protein B0A49_00872 [Cryomyces minteri]|uniref:Uncharacterized protein n=1 Tax=Cryomyces minteri TaxID=331657 RepID=A0A4U0Y0B1_9PEZI|nr:hypothetical protein B0A49_03569 [Cryomyces minteri]TKA80678.1 hypothetical protein B0A49_01627 [Cryomyces minteri]TKA81413.1 hypothetical protein B0A49_00872 [Cryomyces minteri]